MVISTYIVEMQNYSAFALKIEQNDALGNAAIHSRVLPENHCDIQSGVS